MNIFMYIYLTKFELSYFWLLLLGAATAELFLFFGTGFYIDATLSHCKAFFSIQ